MGTSSNTFVENVRAEDANNVRIVLYQVTLDDPYAILTHCPLLFIRGHMRSKASLSLTVDRKEVEHWG